MPTLAPNAVRYSQQSLADELGVPRRTVQYWITEKLIPRAHGDTRWAYYDDTHVKAGRALLAVKHQSASLKDVADYLQEAGISVVQYVQQRGIESYA